MKHILLVEDDPLLIDIYSTKLKEAEFTVEVAEDGEEAVRKIEKGAPDLVLLDIVLPNFDGWQFLEMIRKDGKLKDLKVVVLSNLSQKEEVEKGLSLGASKYLIKAHYTPSQIVEEVKKELNV